MIKFTFGSATDFLIGFNISVLMVGVPKTLSSSPVFVKFLVPNLVDFPKPRSSFPSCTVASPLMHLAAFQGSLFTNDLPKTKFSSKVEVIWL